MNHARISHGSVNYYDVDTNKILRSMKPREAEYLEPRVVYVNKYRTVSLQSIQQSSFEKIEATCCEFYKMTRERVRTRTRKQEVVDVRQTIMFICTKMTNLSLGRIGEFCGGFNHTSVLHSRNVIQGYIDINDEIGLNVLKIMDVLNA